MYRNEWKYLISAKEAKELKDRFGLFLNYDIHAGKNGYKIRSLYFDDYKNSAYNEKLMGIYDRKKWRIRIYNGSDEKISLEKKRKKGSYIYKYTADITREEFYQILDKKYMFLLNKENSLFKEFYTECICNQLKPKVIVDYTRIPFVKDTGTIRLTFDENIRAAVGSFDIFNDNLPTVPAIDKDMEILEVKYTDMLPITVKKLLSFDNGVFISFSKYVSCCDAAGGEKYKLS